MQEKTIYKYRLKITKNKELCFISHLDWQSLILKVFRRLELKLVLSQGFNPMPKVSYSPALPIFLESDCELVNFQTHEQLKDNFIEEFLKRSLVLDFMTDFEAKLSTANCILDGVAY